MNDRGKFVTYTVLWTMVALVVGGGATFMASAFAWHKERPHEGAVTREELNETLGNLKGTLERQIQATKDNTAAITDLKLQIGIHVAGHD